MRKVPVSDDLFILEVLDITSFTVLFKGSDLDVPTHADKMNVTLMTVQIT
jgi:hypothetical protein